MSQLPAFWSVCNRRLQSLCRFQALEDTVAAPPQARSEPACSALRHAADALACGALRHSADACQSIREPGVSPNGGVEFQRIVVLGEFRRSFRKLQPSHGKLWACDVVRAWSAMSQQTLMRELDASEQELLELSASRFIELLDVNMDGCVEVDEWVHHALLNQCQPDAATIDAISKALREHDCLAVVGLINDWELGHEVWTQESLGGAEKSLRVAARSAEPPRARSYVEFCAQWLGLEFSPVELRFYDLSNGYAKYFAPICLCRRLDGVWHTSVVVHGREFYLYGQVQQARPDQTHFGEPTATRILGHTLRSEFDMLRFRRVEMEDCTRDSYDALSKNCNHASERIIKFLLGRSIPDEVLSMSQNLVASRVVRLLLPVVNRWLGGARSISVRKVQPAASPSGKMVMFDDPESGSLVLALASHRTGDGCVDLRWFDELGAMRHSSRVAMDRLRPLPHAFKWPRWYSI